MTREFVVQCPAWIAFHADNDTAISLRCRREKDHEGNHSANAFQDATVAECSDGDPVFRLDWRTNDGVVYQRYPKRKP